jgi:hypothetical protein
MTDLSGLLLLILPATLAAVAAWRCLPAILGPVHDDFRKSGWSPIYSRTWDGRLVKTPMTIEAAACEFDSSATFTLLPPAITSHAQFRGEGVEIKVKARTTWPNRRTKFIVESGS